MRRSSFATASLFCVVLLAGCHEKTQGDAVRETYDAKADNIEAVADNQTNPVKQQIYQDQADSYREEGKDREKGLEGKQPSAGIDMGKRAKTGG